MSDIQTRIISVNHYREIIYNIALPHCDTIHEYVDKK